ELASVTNPVRRAKTGEVYGDDDDDADTGVDDRKPFRPTPAPVAAPTPTPAPTPAPAAPAPPAVRAPVPVAVAPTHEASSSTPQIGAAFLARSAPSKLPWVLVATLAMAVVGLVAYIVM